MTDRTPGNTGSDAAVQLGIPAVGLVVLVGISGSGKSTFAGRHFAPSEVISSDFCRALVCGDENDQTATPDAFSVLDYIAGVRLRRGLLTVIDATSVQPAARAQLVRLARDHDVLVDAIVLDVPEPVAVQRNSLRPDRFMGAHVLARQARDLRRSMPKLKREGFRRVHILRGEAEISAARVVRERSWNDRRDLCGPFDIIGDVHGCLPELTALLGELGWELREVDGRVVGATHPAGRVAVFVGDLVDRGPDTPGVLRLVMAMVAAGTAVCVSGNHEVKLVRAMAGANVTVSHGLAESLAQLAAESDDFRSSARTFMSGLISHFVLDEGRLVVAHAGLKEAYHGRSSGRVRAFALYGDTTGETDEFGLPVRYPWAQEYRGAAAVVYGHTPVASAEWVNNTICLDTGAVFGGSLSALRYPEREVVSVPASRQWYQPARPLQPAAPDREPAVLRHDDVAGTRWLDSQHAGRVKIPEENAAAALEVMSRFAVDPRWLVYLPPTMSPARAATLPGFLEHPEQAFTEYAGWGVARVVCQEKHMGSRAIAVLASDPDVAARRFGVADGSAGAIYTRTGRPFFPSTDLVDRLRTAAAPLLAELDTDWVALDCELLPWSAKALDLIKGQYAAVGAAAGAALPAALRALELAAGRGLDVGELIDRTRGRLANSAAFREVYAEYVHPTDGLEGVTLAPFQVLAVQGRALAVTESHEWHMAQLGALTAAGSGVLTPTRHLFVDLDSPEQRSHAVDWWLGLTASGGEGMVVKPAGIPAGRVQPGLKVRGRQYLRLIYGPDYLDSLDLLRERNLGRKRSLALREHGLGLDALSAFVLGKPLWQVHQFVFAVLALESEPVDPRL